MLVTSVIELDFDFEHSVQWYDIAIDHGDEIESLTVGLNSNNEIINNYWRPILISDYKAAVIRRAIELQKIRP